MKKMILMLAVVGALSGCDNREALVQRAVQDVLVDPESARFSDDILVHGHGAGLVACGSVNAKNSMGGYTGNTGFMGWGGDVYLDEGDYAVSTCCYSVLGEQMAGATVLSQDASKMCATHKIGVGRWAPSLHQ